MIIVSDATPIISLVKIESLEILGQMYGKVIIPQAVYDELVINTDFREEIDYINRCSFIEKKIAENNLSVTLLQKQLKLDLGESEAIVLANSINADIIIIDERKARKIAKDIGLKVTGTLGILVEAKNQGLITKIKPLLDKLISNDIRISKKLYQGILELVGEL